MLLSSGMVRSLIHLPDEILNSVLCYSSPRSCAALEQTNTRFRPVTNEPLLWREYCQSHYKFWDNRHEIRQKLSRPVQSTDWKALFVSRYLVDCSVTRILGSILDSQTGRIEKFRSVVDLGYDAKDTLLRHGCVNSGDDVLARRWACLHEIGIYCPQVDQCFVVKGIDPGREYHTLDHNFLGMALQTTGHNSLPLVSAVIFCFVARGIGLNAQPCGFPFHVHVIVTPQPGLDMEGNTVAEDRKGEPLYLDPFRGARETPISALRSQLAFLGMSTQDQITTLGESDTSAVVLRCGKNILNSIRLESQHPEALNTSMDVVSAKYAAIWSVMLLSSDSRPTDLRHHLPRLMELFVADFPSDLFLIEKYIVPLFQGLYEHEHILERLHVMKTVDEIPKRVRRRSEGNTSIRYAVGQVFRHRRYNYTAVITGWDSECGAGEPWMMRMGIDRLEAGRHQSFYHVL
ncbi:unnamed protein product [Penicillium salamii]|uniref:F-box domain-containing protein n=1 Tax=Penicillium salamii TaxID=1612424 RepID=A0A9W4IES8_9EURO|nr:unnamed protein product [Penicillium salamii]CAG8271669.1 unnamed protein product [Penicillium salamii]